MFSPQTLKWNKFLEHDNKDWNTPEMMDTIREWFDKCVIEGYEMYMDIKEFDGEQRIELSDDIKVQIKPMWDEFVARHKNEDWNTPEMKYNVKNAFDKCVSLGFFTGLTSDCENENDTEK